jgi:MerR family regulatory protein
MPMYHRKGRKPGKHMTPRKGSQHNTGGKGSNSSYISDLSEKLDVSIKTLKNWEQKKLIPKARRNVFGWRIYTQAELDKIEQIVRNNNFFRQKNHAG